MSWKLWLGTASVWLTQQWLCSSMCCVSLLDPTKQMTQQALQHSFMVNDLVHVQGGQFARLAHRIALQRKLNVVRSLNVQDQ